MAKKDSELSNRITEEMVRAAHKEGIAQVMNILEVSLRVRNTETRQKYLQSVKPRYANEPDISAFIDLLIERL
ncbi:MAG: hypothetical protein LBD24_01440 [Spirochaetaceae bacterium]|nr:hypothetical protein [Spirochaetaceae bacterium]